MVDRYKELVPTPRNGYVRMGVRSHAKGTFLTEVEPGQQIEEQELSKVKTDNLVVNIVFAWEHAVAITSADDAKALVSHRFPQFSFHDDMEPGFFRYAILDEAFRWHLWLASPSGAGRNKTLNVGTMLEYEFSVPKKAEQAKIAAFFDRLDGLITLHQRKCQYRGLYGYLSWEQRKLGEFSKKKTTKNADGALSETFTNSAEQGVISQLDYFDHDITNDANISGYYVVQPDDFVYNPRISATAPCGPINRNRLNRAGVMSPLYTVFSADSSVDKTYLEHYFKTSRWHAFMFLEGNSGARSDRFSISDATFFEMPIWCPEISEQMAIAKQLETADSLITLHQREPRFADTG